MEGLILKLLNMSIQASFLTGVVVILRFLFRRMPKWIHCLLWGLVAIRLVCPFSVESAYSLAPKAEVVGANTFVEEIDIQPEVTEYNYQEQNESEKNRNYESVSAAAESQQSRPVDLIPIISTVWLAGVIVLVLYALISYLRMRKKVKLSIHRQDNIYICDRIDSPFILGTVKPHIYIPSGITDVQTENVIAHEKAHLKRLDHIWKPLGFCLLTVYWFQPFCWIAYILLCRDIELACDEMVIRNMNVDQKKIYSKVLLSFSEPGRLVSACPLAFGEVGIKYRIKSIMNYKKPSFWTVIVAFVAIIATSVFFLTNPKESTYEITFCIPAGCEGQLVFSDEEISPQKNNVFFSVGRDVGDLEICVKGVELKNGNEYEESAYVTPGMPTRMELELDGWYGVGIYLSNETDEEQTVHVTVKNVEVRIASATDITVEEEPLKNMVEVSVPAIDMAATTGADGSTIFYADADRFIFGGYYGLFVYDVTDHQITRSVDLAPIGCNFTQGDNACEIEVTEDGSLVLLRPISSNMMYVYSVDDNQMWMEPDSLEGYDLYRDKYKDKYDGVFAPFEQDGSMRHYCLVNDTIIGELGYAVDEQSSYRRIFDNITASTGE